MSEIRPTAAAVGRWPRVFFLRPADCKSAGGGLHGRGGGLQGHVGKAVLRGGAGRCRGFVVATVDGFGAWERRFGWLRRPLWGEVRGTHADCLRGGVHGAAASGRECGGFG